MENEKVTLQVGDQELEGKEFRDMTNQYKLAPMYGGMDFILPMPKGYVAPKKAKSSFKQKLRASGKVKNRKSRAR